MKITIYRTEYVPTEDGDRDILREDQDTHEFDDPREAAEYLVKQGIDEPSSSPDYHHTVWWSDDPYHHPEGYVVEQTAHRDEPTTTDDQWYGVWVRLTGNPGDIVSHAVTSMLTPPRSEHYPNRTYVSAAVASIARVAILKLAGELDEHDDLRQMIEAYNDGTLDDTTVDGPTDTEDATQLVHRCRAVVCDVEPGNTLANLISEAATHYCR